MSDLTDTIARVSAELAAPVPPGAQCAFCPQRATQFAPARQVCRQHCVLAEEGDHTPYWNDAAIAADHGHVLISSANTIIVDVPCLRCGQSGSIAVPVTGPDADVQWE